MLKRKAYQKLVEWKNTHRNNCLMVKGARQVGKTYLVREFGKKEYKSFVEINFIKNQELKQIFAGTLDAESVYKRMTAMINGVNLVKGDTLSGVRKRAYRVEISCGGREIRRYHFRKPFRSDIRGRRRRKYGRTRICSYRIRNVSYDVFA